MPIFVTLGHLGSAGLLVSLLAIESPPPEPQEQFQIGSADPRATDYEPRFRYAELYLPLRVTNHLIGVFGPKRPLAYGLDLQLGFDLQFDSKRTSILVRPETGYALVHHAEFDSHASITGLGIGLQPLDGYLLVLYEPSFVAGSESGQLSLGLRHGLEIYLPIEAQFLSLEIQHGVTWVGSAGARHELRGALTIDILYPIWWAALFLDLLWMDRRR